MSANAASLHLVRAPIDMRGFHRWGADRGLVGRAGFDEGHGLHHLLTECFGRGAIASFRLMVAPTGATATLYGYSTQSADALRAEAARVAPPEHLAVLPLDRLESKPMSDDWPANHRLGFDLKLRPVSRSRRPDDETSRGERDVFLREALGRAEGEMAAMGRTREVVYRDWLAAQFDRHRGARLDAARLVHFQRTMVRRSGTAGSEGPEIVLHGDLTVTEPAAFGNLIARGIGRHRAYGYGMLLLRPVHRTAGRE